jgi:hypothetical protein
MQRTHDGVAIEIYSPCILTVGWLADGGSWGESSRKTMNNQENMEKMSQKVKTLL